MDKLLAVLKRIKPDIDWENEQALIDDELLDSFDIIAILNAINNAFGLELTVSELLPENFNNLEAINALVEEALEDM